MFYFIFFFFRGMNKMLLLLFLMCQRITPTETFPCTNSYASHPPQLRQIFKDPPTNFTSRGEFPKRCSSKT